MRKEGGFVLNPHSDFGYASPVSNLVSVMARSKSGESSKLDGGHLFGHVGGDGGPMPPTAENLSS